MAESLVSGLAKFKIDLPANIIERELLFLDELLRWNQRVNLTSIRNRNEGLEKHLLDSLVLLGYLPESGRMLDMGSGGGFPGIPLAIARPDLRVVSVDSVGKKIQFQKHIKRLLALGNLQPTHSRLEDLEPSKPFDFVVARALSDFPALVRFSAPLLQTEGKLLVMKGPEGRNELNTYLATDDENKFKVEGIHEYQLPESLSERLLVVLTRKP